MTSADSNKKDGRRIARLRDRAHQTVSRLVTLAYGQGGRRSKKSYRSMSDVELLNAYREILVAKRRQILWRAMENHNAAEKKIPNPGADHEKLAVLSSGSSCCTELHDIQMKIAALDAAVIEEEKRHQGMTRAA